VNIHKKTDKQFKRNYSDEKKGYVNVWIFKL
jgi:hypothetical protein